MKKSFLFCCFIATMLVSCKTEIKEVATESKIQTWEYEVVKVVGKNAKSYATASPLVFDDQKDMLNKMGQEGWELVNIYTEIATVFPNFGNGNLVHGIRDNVRTRVVYFVFKRPSYGVEESKDTESAVVAKSSEITEKE